jgi:ABC-type dipeptide/oligopeptide/nickel transport system ATPase component
VAVTAQRASPASCRAIRVLQAPAHPYTEGLFASTVHNQPPERDIDAIPGSPPDLRRLPPGFPEPGHMAAFFAVTGAVSPPT